MNNIMLNLSFDGTNYHGFQRQKNGITIQEALETALSKLYKENIVITGCSRTDSGVHALSYACNFKTEKTIPPEKLPLAVNSLLNVDIRVHGAKLVSDDFNSCFCAVRKTYNYFVHNSRIGDPFLSRYSLQIPQKLNTKNMQDAAKAFIGEHDFKAFCAAGSTAKTTNRTIYDFSVTEKENNLIVFSVTGNGFLYNMVRIMVGTLIEVGNGKFAPEDISLILSSRNRTMAGYTVAPQGLFLSEIIY